MEPSVFSVYTLPESLKINVGAARIPISQQQPSPQAGESLFDCYFSISVTSSLPPFSHSYSRKILPFYLIDSVREFGNKIEDVIHYTHIRSLENGCLGVFIDGNDKGRAFDAAQMLKGAADP